MYKYVCSVYGVWFFFAVNSILADIALIFTVPDFIMRLILFDMTLVREPRHYNYDFCEATYFFTHLIAGKLTSTTTDYIILRS